MPKQDPLSDKKIRLGRSTNPDKRNPPPSLGKGRIETNWRDIDWTPKKSIIVSTVLMIPYLVAVIGCFVARIYFMGYALVGLAILMGLLIWVLRTLDREDF